MNQCEFHRIEVDNPRGVASVVVASCTQGGKFYAEYLVLHELPQQRIPRQQNLLKFHCIKETGEGNATRILQYALKMAKERISAVGLGDAPGNEQDIDVLKNRHREEMEQFYKEVNAKLKCQCLKELLKPSSVGVPHLRD